MLLRRCLTASALLATTYAQSSTSSADQTVISVFMIGGAGDEGVNLYASVIDSDETATTMKVDCDNSGKEEGETCNLFAGFEVIQGLSTFAAGYTYDGLGMTIGCDLTDSTIAFCSQTADMPVEPEFTGTATVTDIDEAEWGTTTLVVERTIPPSSITYYPVTITAGLTGTGSEEIASSTTSGEDAASSTASGADASQTSVAADESSDAHRIGMKASCSLAGLLAFMMMAM